MEANLFWIGCGLWGYAFVLRKLFSMPGLLQRRFIARFLHILFLSGVGALFGFVFSASMDLHGPSPKWPIACAALGFVVALVQIVAEARKAEGDKELLADDLEWAETSFSAILLAAVIMYAVMQAFKIPSGSMENTLLVGDHLFVNKFIYGIRVPFTDKRVSKLRNVRRDDVVVFQAPDSATFSVSDPEHNVHKDFIKRAIGLPGDIVQIKDKHVYVNGQMLTEPYTVHRDPMDYPAEHLGLSAADYQSYWESGRFNQLRREEIGDNFGPIKVPPDSYFVMGDNRDASFDSRFWGPLPNRLLKGKAWIIYWPLSRLKVIR